VIHSSYILFIKNHPFINEWEIIEDPRPGHLARIVLTMERLGETENTGRDNDGSKDWHDNATPFRT